MRRNGRRALALLLTLVMALCLTVPALAAEEVFEAETPAGLAEDAPAAPIGPEAKPAPDVPEAASAEPVDAPAAEPAAADNVYKVGTADELKKALMDPEEGKTRFIRLTDNIELKEPINIGEQDGSFLLELNGKTVKKTNDIPAGAAAITVQGKGSLAIQGDGTITGPGTLLQTDNSDSSLHLWDVRVNSSGDGSYAAVCASGLVGVYDEGVVIEADGTAIYVSAATVMIHDGRVVSRDGCAVVAGGGNEMHPGMVMVRGGTIESDTGAGVCLLPGGLLAMGEPSAGGTDAVIIGKAGVVALGGTASILSGNVIANGTDRVQVGDVFVPPAAVVADNMGVAGLFDGVFSAAAGQPAVVYTKNGQPANDKNRIDGWIQVTGGSYSSAVDEALLSTDVRYMLMAEGDAPYTYLTSSEDVKEMQEQLRCAAIVAAGFIGTTETGGNDILNGCAREVLGEEKSITDCIPNTLYAVFKAASGYAGPYTVQFRAGEEKTTYTETSPAGGVFYASFDHQADVFKDSPEGWYVAELYKGERTETLVSSAYFMICKVTYAPGGGAQGEAVTVYTDEAGLEAALAAGRPDGITLSGGSNTWDEPVAERTGRFSWTVTFPAHYEYHGGLIIPDTTPSPSPSASPEPPQTPSPDPTPTPGPGVTPSPVPVPVDPPKTNGGSGWSYDYDTGDYYYFVDGEPKANYWANEADASQWGFWYYVGADGKLATGLQYIENNNGTGWYFLQPDNADGCIGRMLTGWQWLGPDIGMGWFNTAHGGVNGQCTWTENWGDYNPATGLWEDGLSHK